MSRISFSDENGNFSLKKKGKLFQECPFSFDSSDYRDPREWKKFIKACESSVRHSRDYAVYIKSLKEENPALQRDVIFNNLTSEDTVIELHHFPLTLFELCEIIALHKIVNKQELTSFILAKELMHCHAENIIGLVPVSVTTHKLNHHILGKSKEDIYKRVVTFTKKQVFGDWERFLERYKDGLDYELEYKIKIFKEMDENKEQEVTIDTCGLFES